MIFVTSPGHRTSGRRRDPCVSPLSCQDQVRGVRRRYAVGACVREGRQIETREEILAPAEKDGRHDEMHLVDQSGAQILPDGRDATADADILSVGGVPSMS